MPTPNHPIHNILEELGIPGHKVASMADQCHVIPRGYAINKKETSKNMDEKKAPSSNSSITQWEIYIPPPFPPLLDMISYTRDNLYITSFKNSTFHNLESATSTTIHSSHT